MVPPAEVVLPIGSGNVDGEKGYVCLGVSTRGVAGATLARRALMSCRQNPCWALSEYKGDAKSAPRTWGSR